MSTIPNSAMPHAVDPESEPETATGSEEAIGKAKEALGGLIKGVEDFARDVGDRLKAKPKAAAIAAGALAVGGIVAAAAVPLVRSARKSAAEKPKAKPASKPRASKPRASKPRATAPRATTTRARKPKGDAAA